MHSQLYGALRMAACEHLKVCTVHCGHHWRVKQIKF